MTIQDGDELVELVEYIDVRYDLFVVAFPLETFHHVLQIANQLHLSFAILRDHLGTLGSLEEVFTVTRPRSQGLLSSAFILVAGGDRVPLFVLLPFHHLYL